MNRSLVSVWLLIGLILLLLPGPAGRLLLDLLGGLTLLLLLTPLILAGLGLLAWKLLVNRLKACPRCGFSSFRADPAVCPACGWREDGLSSDASWPAADSAMVFGLDATEIPASDVTITVNATGVVDDPDQN
jgi:ribosomal protein L37E